MARPLLLLVFCLLFAGSLALPRTPTGPGGGDTVWTVLGGALPGAGGEPRLDGAGDVAPGGDVTLFLSRAAPAAAAWIVAGTSEIGAPFLGGVLVPAPDYVVGPLATDADGELVFEGVWPAGAPSGVDLFFQAWIADSTGPSGATASNALRAGPAPAPEPGTFPAHWIEGGPDCGSEPPLQVHAYNEDFHILRQSLCTSFEAPFLYLIFGADRAVLWDTGHGAVNLGPTVYGIVDQWKAAHGVTDYELVVAHTHAHVDHVTGDGEFLGQPDTTVVGSSLGEVQAFFGIASWPDEIVAFDLGGGRVLDVLPTPGHHETHLSVYDRKTGILITADNLYPGYVLIVGATTLGTWPAFQASIQRTVDFVDGKSVAWVLGCHVFMKAQPGEFYWPYFATWHPDEHALELGHEHLLELNVAVQGMGDAPVVEIHDDFVLLPIL